MNPKHSLISWLWHWLRLAPHFIIQSGTKVYMRRWYLIPRNPWLNVYLHQFLADDDDRALHDHPWWFVSIMVRGRYYEIILDERVDAHRLECRTAPSIAYRPATHRHRVVLVKDATDNPIPCWTIVVTGPVRRVWGFWCPGGWRPYSKFKEQGCDE